MKFKFTITWQLGLVLALFGAAAAGLTGYYVYHASRALLVNAAEDRMLTATRVLVRQMAVALESTAADVTMLSEHPQVVRLLRRSLPDQQAFGENNFAVLFQRMLKTRPAYFQMRLIDAEAHGIERIRVDRDTAGVLRIEGDDLQEKGHMPYVFETLRLPRGRVYVSHARINHEVGAHAGQDKPSLQVAAPVLDHAGQVHGVIVISVDLDGLFAQLSADLPPALGLYLANGAGDFLIHPDRQRAFAFDRGQRALVQEEFPAVTGLLADVKERQNALVTRNDAARVAAFVRLELPRLDAEDEFILGLSQPLAAVLEESDRLGDITLRIVLALGLSAILIAMLLARTLIRPLQQIVQGVSRFANGEKDSALPLARMDEIGTLARSVDHMQTQITSQLETLHRQKDELNYLASNDNLTGLPNRRIFLDRLDQALVRARRNNSQFSLLFLDLDNFKRINDTLGHAAGDAVLHDVAQRLQLQVREADTVARLGGDEFIILLEGTDDSAVIDHVVAKVMDALAPPIVYQGNEILCSGSIGVGRYPQDGDDPAALIAAADSAMYRTKQEPIYIGE